MSLLLVCRAERRPGGPGFSWLDLDLVLAVLAGGAAGSRMLEVRGPLIAKGEFRSARRFRLPEHGQRPS